MILFKLRAILFIFLFFGYNESILGQINAKCQIEGIITGLSEDEKVTISLLYEENNFLPYRMAIDSARVKNGHFKLEFENMSGPRLFFLFFEKHPDKFIVLVMGNEKVKVTGNLNTAPRGNVRQYFDVEGSKIYNDYFSLSNLGKLLIPSYDAIGIYLDNLKDSIGFINKSLIIEGVIAARKIFTNALFSYLSDVISEYPDSQVIPKFLFNLYSRIGKEAFLKSIYHMLNETARGSYYGKLLKENLASLIGEKAPDFTTFTDKLEKLSFKDVIKNNKLTILYFWSSAPSFPYSREKSLFELQKYYNKYHSKGLDIVGVCVDQNVERWKNIAKEDALPWYQVIDSLYNGSSLSKLYFVGNGVWPCNYLIDENGEILAWNIEGVLLQYYINKVFNF